MTMTFQSTALATVFAALLCPASAIAQQPPPVDHSAHGATPQAAGADDCMTAQSKVSATAATARERLETARQTNEPAKLRAAVDEALLAIGALLSATEPCRTAPPMAGMAGMDHSAMAAPQPGAPVSPRPPAAAADPHAGMNMPNAPARPAARPAAKPAAKPADPHAGMNMGTPAKPAARPRATPGAKPASKAADPHAGMAMPSGAKTADDPKKLACTPKIDLDNAPTTTYKGKAYYFCTAADRLRFIMNPEAYLKSAGGK